jgi:NAD(P)-dependent dehydrogenase (short-subunit alcohol dehydrogenase family)
MHATSASIFISAASQDVTHLLCCVSDLASNFDNLSQGRAQLSAALVHCCSGKPCQQLSRYPVYTCHILECLHISITFIDLIALLLMKLLSGLSGYGPQAAYCASKGALIPLAKSLAIAWAPDQINVNVVLPGQLNGLLLFLQMLLSAGLLLIRPMVLKSSIVCQMSDYGKPLGTYCTGFKDCIKLGLPG